MLNEPRPNLPPNHGAIANKIYLIRGVRVMIDRDLAELYSVPAKVLNQAVKRNNTRFPSDFMFQLTWAETKVLRSQFVTLKRGAHNKYRPYVFTEQGVAMLSSVLNSERAIHANIKIMRTFTQIREFIASNTELKRRIDDLERKFDAKCHKHDQQIKVIFEAIRQLMNPPEPTRKPIGFHT